MKTSLSKLPPYAKTDLKQIVALVLEKLPQTEMIILYGSYARGTYVEYDERDEFGILTSFMSDYDILVITSEIDSREVGRLLDIVDQIYYRHPDQQTPIQFITDDIVKFNSDLSEGRYFYTDIKKEGIMLYDSKKFKLERARKLRFNEIRQQAEEYFQEKFESADEFLETAKFHYSKKWYRKAAFMLHQACENYFYALRLVHTLKNSKQHNLFKLLAFVRKYSSDLNLIFPQDSVEEKRLFYLVKSAYVEARYNPQFIVTKEDIQALIPKIEKLRQTVEIVCKTQIEKYRKIEQLVTTRPQKLPAARKKE